MTTEVSKGPSFVKAWALFLGNLARDRSAAAQQDGGGSSALHLTLSICVCAHEGSFRRCRCLFGRTQPSSCSKEVIALGAIRKRPLSALQSHKAPWPGAPSSSCAPSVTKPCFQPGGKALQALSQVIPRMLKLWS